MSLFVHYFTVVYVCITCDTKELRPLKEVVTVIKVPFVKWKLDGTTLSASAREYNFIISSSLCNKTRLSPAFRKLSHRKQSPRRLRILRDDFRLFPSKLWFIALHLVLTLTLPPAPSSNSGWVLFTFSESIDRGG